jgi:hypothetical protein
VSLGHWGAKHPPRWYAAKILAAKTREERKALAHSVPEHLRPIVRSHIDRALAARK